MGYDLSQTARANAQARRAQADATLAADSSGRLERFRDLSASSVFATNVQLEKLELYDRAGAVVDARTCCIVGCGGDEAAGLALFVERQEDYFVRRERFEDLWEHGRRFVYGAMHAGGAGVPSFGPICLVLADLASQAPDALGVFPQDTAQRYTDASAAVDESRALSEATAWEDRGALAVVERAAGVLAHSPAEWPELLCSDDDYLEVDVAGPLELAAIERVLLPEDTRVELERLRAAELLRESDALLGRSISEADSATVRLYDVLHRWRRRTAMTIEGVPSA